jgi:plastocyanin
VRYLVLSAALLITAAGVACGGGGEATQDATEFVFTQPANTVTPTTPVPAPPWATNSPGSNPTADNATASPAPVDDTPTMGATQPPATQPPATQPPAQPTATATPRLLQTVDVTVVNNLTFSPNRVEVPAGSTINFSWNGDVPHTVSSPDAGFNSGDPAKADSLSVVLTQPGTYQFLCETHPTTMKGLITVTP